MVDLFTCKNKEDPIKNESARVVTTLFIDFFRCSRAANSIKGDGTLTKFKPIQAFIFALVICKNEYDLFKFESTRVVSTFLPFWVYGDFLRRSRAAYPKVQGLNWPYFEPIQAFMVDLFTCKNKEDPIKNEGARVVTTLFIDFFRCSRAANSIKGDGTLTKFKPIQAFIFALVICKNEYDLFKFESTRVVSTFLPI